MPAAKAKPKSDALVESMNDFARDLLKQASGDGRAELGLAAKMDIFAKVAAWIGIRNRIDETEGGSELDGYRSRLKTAGADHQRAPNVSGFRDFDTSARGGRRTAVVRGHTTLDPDDDGDGSGIAALKSRIPERDDAGDRLDLGDGAGGAGAAAAGDAGRVHAGDDDRERPEHP